MELKRSIETPCNQTHSFPHVSANSQADQLMSGAPMSVPQITTGTHTRSPTYEGTSPNPKIAFKLC